MFNLRIIWDRTDPGEEAEETLKYELDLIIWGIEKDLLRGSVGPTTGAVNFTTTT